MIETVLAVGAVALICILVEDVRRSLIEGVKSGFGIMATLRHPVSIPVRDEAAMRPLPQQEQPAMELSDRLGLLSLVATVWLITAALLGAAIAIGIVVSRDPVDYATPDENLVPIFIWTFLVAVPAWFLSWGLVSVAVFGSYTTLRNGRLRTQTRDVVVLVLGSMGWSAVGFSLGYGVFLFVVALLAVAVVTGFGVLIWRVISRASSP